MTFPLVSIVITTKNEEKNIGNCLLSIFNQTYPKEKLEVIVVDNNSSDQTKEIARKYTDKVFDKGPERSAQRNYGLIDLSRGEYLMFLDADMVLSPQVVESSVIFLESHEAVGALHISEVVLGKKFFSRVRRFERSFYDGTVIDGARFFRKSVFVAVGGFDLSLSGPEDWDIDKKIKQVCQLGLLRVNLGSHFEIKDWILKDFIISRGVDPERSGAVIYHNEAEFDLGKYLAKKGYYAQSFESYINKWGPNDLDVRKQLGWRYRFFGVFMEQGKWKRLIAHPLLALGMYFLRLLVGIKFLTNRAH